MTNSMKEIQSFQVGSKMFFNEIEGFNSKDSDWLHLMEGWLFEHPSVMMRKGNEEHFLYPDNGISMIEHCLEHEEPITAGKFLSKEFCEYIGSEITYIRKLNPLFDKIDEKHKYEAYIFQCYMENGDIYLTEEQLKEAYRIYQKPRNNDKSI